MRRSFLLAALCMIGALAFAPVALAQSSSASAGAEQTPDSPCPTDIDEFPLGTQCGEGGGYILPDGGSVSPVITADSSYEPCDGGPARETPDGTQCIDSADVTPGSASPDATVEADEDSNSATAEADDEESASAGASAESVEDLPDTGGVSPALLTVLPALLLVGSGILAVKVVRRT